MADDRTPGDVLPPPLAELADIRQWVAWKRVKDPKNPAKPRKMPRTYDDRDTGANEPNRNTWSTYSEVHRGVMKHWALAGAGFVFTTQDQYSGVDLDKCGDRATGQIEPWAQAIVDRLESYTEWSVSGTGVHILCRGGLPVPGGKNRNHVEMYDSLRYFTVTGRGYGRWGDLPITERTDVLAAVYWEHFPPTTPTITPVPVATRMPSSQTDDDLCRHMFAASNGKAIERLWQGDNGAHSGDASRGDLALCGHLAFWTNADRLRMDALFRASRRMRDKWDERHHADGRTYGQGTIDLAIASSSTTIGQGGSAGSACAPEREAGALMPGEGHALTDSGNAALFVSVVGMYYRWLHDEGKWLRWDGRRWASESNEFVRQVARTGIERTALELAVFGPGATGPKEHKRRLMHLERSQGRARLEAMVDLSKGDPVVLARASLFDRDADRLVVSNGVVDLRTGVMSPHCPGDLLTRIVEHVGEPAAYVPVADQVEPVVWRTFFERAQPDAGVRRYIQLLVGAALTGTGVQRSLVVFQGPGGAGKGTFMSTLMSALGNEASGYVTNSDADVLMENPKGLADGNGAMAGLARWRGRRVVWMDETATGRKLDVGRVKRLVPGAGGEVIARDLYQRGRDAYSFPASWLPIITTNRLPTAPGDDDATWDRIVVVPFDNRVPLDERTNLSGELPVNTAVLRWVLAWAVEGAVDVHALWRNGAVPVPLSVLEATDAWRRRSETHASGATLGDWIVATGALESHDYEETLANLHASHTTWAQTVRQPVLSARAFIAALRSRNCRLVKKRTGNTWSGIGLMDCGADLDDSGDVA